MTIKAGTNLPQTTANCYAEIKALFTAHGGWTNNTDTAPSGKAFLLEYTSDVATIDGEAIKIHIEGIVTTGYAKIGVYDSTDTLRSTTGDVDFFSQPTTFMVGDDFFIACSGGYGGYLAAGKLIDVQNSPFTGRDNLCWTNYISASSANSLTYKARGYSTAGATVNSFNIRAIASGLTENGYVNSGPSGTPKISLYPAFFSLYTSNGLFGTQKSGVFYQTIDATAMPTQGANYTLGGNIYKRIQVSSAAPSFSVVAKWQDVA